LKKLSLSIFLTLYAIAAYSQDIYNTENSKKFASYLYQSEQFELAAIEYERLLFLDDRNDSIKYKLLSSYFENKDFGKAISRSKKLYPSVKDFTDPVANLYLKLLILNEDFSDFDLQYTAVPLANNKKAVYKLHKNVLNREWQEAYDTFNELQAFPFQYKSNFNELLERSKKPDTKSPFLAGILSAIIPGTGKFYTGNFKDGIFSLLVVGGTTFQAIRGFNKDGVNSTSGWIFGTVATGFYAGNIFGSVKSAQVYNENYWLEIENETRILINNSY
jgi:hypothetical protein